MELLGGRRIPPDQIHFLAAWIEEKKYGPAVNLESGQVFGSPFFRDVGLIEDEFFLEKRMILGIFEVLLDQQLAVSSTRRVKIYENHLFLGLSGLKGLLDGFRLIFLRRAEGKPCYQSRQQKAQREDAEFFHGRSFCSIEKLHHPAI